MNVHISINAATAEEAREQMAQLLGVIRGEITLHLPEKSTKATSTETEKAEAIQQTMPIVEPAQEQSAPKRRGRPKKSSPDMIVDEPSQISTGEARTGPEDEPIEIQAQDEADEQTESAATKPAALTHNDLKTAMSGYVKKYGMDAAQADGPLIFKEVLGAPPEGKDYWQLSIVPEDRLQEALAGWNQAAIKNPFDRSAV